jgi:hypothetical protein
MRRTAPALLLAMHFEFVLWLLLSQIASVLMARGPQPSVNGARRPAH